MAVRGLLLDLEGVLYGGGRAIPGAIEAVRRLGDEGLLIRHLTNTTTRPRRAIIERLKAMGLKVPAEHLFSPAAAACRLLEAADVTRIHLAAVASLAEDFAGFELVEDAPQAVVLGDLYKGFTWERLNELFQMVLAGARLVALHRNRYCRRDEGISLDLGPFVAALEYGTGREADVVGKPERSFFELALDDLGLSASDVVMVGDDLEADIGGAQNAGLSAVQVETGKYTPRDRAHPTIRPDLVIPSIADLPAALAQFG
jgi:HAD superfamily hydrolase (TIGR01458 family)